mgnify:CR=1 FL=1
MVALDCESRLLQRVEPVFGAGFGCLGGLDGAPDAGGSEIEPTASGPHGVAPRGPAAEIPNLGPDPPESTCIQSRIQIGMSKSIRVDEETHAALTALKGENETFDDVLARLIADRRERVRAGAGLWEGSDAAEKAREARAEMKRGVGDR